MKKLISTIIILGIIFTLSAQSTNFEISKNMEIYTSVYKSLFQNYVDDINSGELMRTGIDAMLKTLDPYTVYKSESEIEDFRYMTTGQYGGIGALIQQQGDYVVISEPYQGFPADKAGLIAGDKILKIDSKDMKGKSSSDISELMKGEPGSSFEITVERYGEKKPIVKKITREVVSIPSVAFSKVTNDSIGYIYFSSFTANSGAEFKNAYLDLDKEKKLKGLIIDIRSNGGGLLNEAVNIMGMFVPQGEEIVSTKGRIATKNQLHKTTSKPIAPDIPIVVLVDGASASASEILSGSMQDLDRGVIVGQRTFGKGLVQNIVPIAYNSQMKVTVAKYYIPSGRCIQAIDYSHKNEDGKWEKVPDSLMTKFHTKKGRVVWDGAGIQPDVEVEPKDSGEITTNLYINHHIFNFATKYYIEHKNDSINPENFRITDEIWNEFTDYLKDKDYKYETYAEKQLDEFAESIKESEYYASIEANIESMKKSLNEAKNNDLENHREDISYLLGIEIVTRYCYEKGKIIYGLTDDPTYEEAIIILNDPDRYNKILSVKPTDE